MHSSPTLAKRAAGKANSIIQDKKRNFSSYLSHRTSYRIEGKPKASANLVFVLAGYKPYLWDDVFDRLEKFQIPGMDVCIASSGKYSEVLSNLCKQNEWVYLSTKVNNVCITTNLIMKIFESAEFIFKLDEDIYIPKGYFEDMLQAYNEIESKYPVNIGYICPNLPLGFYGMHSFLVESGNLKAYEEKFGKHLIGGTPANPAFRQNCGVDQFIWEIIGNFDALASKYRQNGLTFDPCITRTGVAAILYSRDFWNEIGYLNRGKGIGVGPGGDEEQITSYCFLNYKIVFCVKSVLVGHFSFGGSELSVLELRSNEPEIFQLNDGTLN